MGAPRRRDLRGEHLGRLGDVAGRMETLRRSLWTNGTGEEGVTE